MRKSSILLLASMGWALTACAGAAGWQVRQAPKPEAVVQPTMTGSTQVAARNDTGNPDQIICKREEVTGSRLEGAKECHSRAEWAQIKATGYDKLQMMGAPSAMPNQTAAQAGNGGF
jgi:hypothetical protein